ncbi:MAG: ornithine carbamoyltransferase [Gemmatimonadota bacterium]
MPTHPGDKRDFLAIPDLETPALMGLLDRARRMKAGDSWGNPLAGRHVAMIFRKSSTRTRVSFEVGVRQLGGDVVFLADRDSQVGRGEDLADTARVLSRYVDALVVRTFGHQEVETLAAYGSIPVVNALTDLVHPCQVLADLLTMQENFGEDLSAVPVAWVGDGNNMANSWLNAAYRLGFPLRLACPEGYDPDPAILARARSNADILLTRDPAEAVEGVKVVNTDVWTSMGQEEENERRMAAFHGFMVTPELMSRARSEAIFLHCLPAHRGEEVDARVVDGPWSRVFDEAENRLHVQKSLFVELMVNDPHP